jgi:hypothetical protein
MTVARSITWANASSVTPSDTTEIRATSLYVGGAGNVAVEMAGGDDVTFSGVVAGTQLFIEVAKIKATGTTATNILALS